MDLLGTFGPLTGFGYPVDTGSTGTAIFASSDRWSDPGTSIVMIEEATALRVSTWSIVITGGNQVSWVSTDQGHRVLQEELLA